MLGGYLGGFWGNIGKIFWVSIIIMKERRIGLVLELRGCFYLLDVGCEKVGVKDDLRFLVYIMGRLEWLLIGMEEYVFGGRLEFRFWIVYLRCLWELSEDVEEVGGYVSFEVKR